MSYTFAGAVNFNQDLKWNTTKVTDMRGMFSGASAFNGDVGGFNVRNVIDFSELVRTLILVPSYFFGRNILNLFANLLLSSWMLLALMATLPSGLQ